MERKGVCISCCVSVREGTKFDLEAELGDLGGQAPGFDLGGAAVEVVTAAPNLSSAGRGGAIPERGAPAAPRGGSETARRAFLRSALTSRRSVRPKRPPRRACGNS